MTIENNRSYKVTMLTQALRATVGGEGSPVHIMEAGEKGGERFEAQADPGSLRELTLKMVQIFIEKDAGKKMQLIEKAAAFAFDNGFTMNDIDKIWAKFDNVYKAEQTSEPVQKERKGLGQKILSIFR